MKTMRRKTNGLACALLASLAASTVTAVTATTASGKAGPPQQAASHTVVLPLSEGPEIEESVGPPLGAGTSHYWKPSAGEIRDLEAHLPHSIASCYRQYLGVTCGKTRLILINGFSSDVAPEYIGGKFDWHLRTVRVMDGGMGFFQATYDPHTHKFTGPRFNGFG